MPQPSTITNTPRNPILGLLADAIQPVQKLANKVNVPVIGPLGDFMLEGTQSLLDDASYDGARALGKGGSLQTFNLDPRVVDAASIAYPALKASPNLAKTAGRELARQVQTGTGVGKYMVDPRQNIIAYHGSPHTFDKFSLDKIGTGEGAQAYGHGLYFADSPEVAKSYMNPVVTPKLTDKEIQELVNLKIKSRKNVQSLSNEEIYKMNDLWTKHLNYEDSIKNYKQPSFYKVDIPDEAVNNMLLWDKPLSEQPESVKKALFKLKNNAPKGGMYQESLQPFENTSGNGLIRAFVNDLAMEGNAQPDKTFSMLLNEYGVPGIRYLDQGSRGAGQGTMNTVLFDDSLVKILERNGVPLSGLLD